MGPFLAAWLVGEGIIIYRSVKRLKAPPGPGALLFTSGLFVMLALLADSPKARPLATTLAWGFDLAAFMNLFGTGGPKPDASSAWPPGKAPDTVVIPTSAAPKPTTTTTVGSAIASGNGPKPV